MSMQSGGVEAVYEGMKKIKSVTFWDAEQKWPKAASKSAPPGAAAPTSGTEASPVDVLRHLRREPTPIRDVQVKSGLPLLVFKQMLDELTQDRLASVSRAGATLTSEGEAVLKAFALA